ncbi:MAG: CoA transferase [Halioglobus sp.]
MGLNHPSIAPYGAFSCKGGEQVVIAIQNDREWVSFCEAVLARPDLAGDPHFQTNVGRCANRPALEEEINRVFSQLSARSWPGDCCG